MNNKNGKAVFLLSNNAIISLLMINSFCCYFYLINFVLIWQYLLYNNAQIYLCIIYNYKYEIELIKISKKSKYLNQVEAIYTNSFPSVERIDFANLINNKIFNY